MIESPWYRASTSVGMDVFPVRAAATPAVAMLTRSLRADLGVMISASHNQYHDNGIKLFGPDGQKLSTSASTKIEALMENGLEEGLAEPARIGRARRIEDAQARYIEFVKRTFSQTFCASRVCASWSIAPWGCLSRAPAVLWELGADVFAIGVEPNGIQHQSGSRLDSARRHDREGQGDTRRFGIALGRPTLTGS